MELKLLIARINELYHKSQQTPLTPAELQERNELRRQYLDAITAQVKSTLDRVEVVDESGESGNHDRCHHGECDHEECDHDACHHVHGDAGVKVKH